MPAVNDPLDLGSLKGSLMQAPFSFTKDHDHDDDLNEEMMILGATPNFGSLTNAVGGFARRSSLGPCVENGFHSGLLGGMDDIDDLMGMSPDMPLMIRSPELGSSGFESFIRKTFGTAGDDATSKVAVGGATAAAAAAANGPIMQQGAPSWDNNPLVNLKP